jgi:hypothetical protein
VQKLLRRKKDDDSRSASVIALAYLIRPNKITGEDMSDDECLDRLVKHNGTLQDLQAEGLSETAMAELKAVTEALLKKLIRILDREDFRLLYPNRKQETERALLRAFAEGWSISALAEFDGTTKQNVSMKIVRAINKLAELRGEKIPSEIKDFEPLRLWLLYTTAKRHKISKPWTGDWRSWLH